ncbi:hypothetical protein JCM11491_004657 [Sporobolomyces phaffii]
MELLDESESRAFSSFLDSFATTSASPPPPPPFFAPHYPSSAAPEHSHFDATTTRGTPLAFSTAREVSRATPSWHEPGPSRGDHFANSSSGRNWVTHGVTHESDFDHYSSSSSTSFAPAPPSNIAPRAESASSFALHFAPPPPPPVVPRRSSASYHLQQQLQQQVLDPDAAKQRKLQHAQELERWMAQSRPAPAPPSSADLDAPSPPKRTRSSDERRSSASGPRQGREASGYPEEDAIAAMLEAERKAGYAYGKSMNAAITRETAQSAAAVAGGGGRRDPQESTSNEAFEPDEVFAVPPPPPPVSSRSTRRRPSTSAVTTTATDASFPTAPLDLDSTTKPAISKPKAASSTQPSRQASAASSSSTNARTPRRPSSESPPLDPESADSRLAAVSPTPFHTPRNIPRPSNPPRPRPPPAAVASESTTMTTGSGATTTTVKPALLTVDQKKANHIASEQKRRAAIRAGYDGLCHVVPVLRDAVAEFEERVRRLEEGEHAMTASVGNGKKKRRGKAAGGGGSASTGKTGALMGGINVGGEKIDGRAGPKSEAVVLSKTVDHVRQLLTDRAALLEKLSAAHARARAGGIQVAPAETHEWDEPWQGESDAPDDRPQDGEEDEEMWEDE